MTSGAGARIVVAREALLAHGSAEDSTAGQAQGHEARGEPRDSLVEAYDWAFALIQ